MKKLLIAASLAAVSSTTIAAGAFDGPYVQIGGGISNASNKYDLSLTDYLGPGTINFINADLSKSNIMGQILAGYSYAFGNKFNIAGNIYYDLGDDKSGSFSLFGNEITLETKLKNVWGIGFEPGYYITDTTLGYAKLGYQRGDIKARGAESDFGCCLFGEGYADVSANGVSAFTYGFGIKQLITSNLYLGAEVSRAEYGSHNLTGTYNGSNAIPDFVSTKSDVSKTSGLVTIGYKF